jgi:curved DNA-binding protein CbpA
MSGFKSYYQILQVSPSAKPGAIKAAYRRLALKYHPDTNKSPDSTIRMQEINEAYEVLSDSVKRERYNQQLNEQQSAQSHSTYDGSDYRRDAEADVENRREQERAKKAQPTQDEHRKKAESLEARIREIERAKYTENSNRLLGITFVAVYCIVAYLLFQLGSTWINSFWAGLLVFIVAGFITLPIVFLLDKVWRGRWEFL